VALDLAGKLHLHLDGKLHELHPGAVDGQVGVDHGSEKDQRIKP